MLDTLKTMLYLFGAHYTDIILAVVIMVSAIIVAIGLLKPIVFNRITNKYIRKAVLSFSNVAACFIASFAYFLIEGWNLKYYFLASVALSVCCIVTYWFYENTCMRNLIGVIGGIALRKVMNIANLAITSDDVNAVQAEIKNATAQLKTVTKQELKKNASKITYDKDLKGL